jgi:hypothetical protein
MVEIDITASSSERSERVDVPVADLAPVAKLDSEFESRPGAGHEFGFIDSETLVEGADVRQGGFADSDNSDRFGLDEMH